MGSRPSARGSLSGQQESVRKGSAPDRTRTMHKLGEDRLMGVGTNEIQTQPGEEEGVPQPSQAGPGKVRFWSG